MDKRILYAGSVMEHGLILPCNHALGDDDIDFVCAVVDDVVTMHVG